MVMTVWHPATAPVGRIHRLLCDAQPNEVTADLVHVDGDNRDGPLELECIKTTTLKFAEPLAESEIWLSQVGADQES